MAVGEVEKQLADKVVELSSSRKKYNELGRRIITLSDEISELRKLFFDEVYGLNVGDAVFIYETEYRFAGLPKVMQCDWHVLLKGVRGGRAFSHTGDWSKTPKKRPVITLDDC